MEPEGQRKEKAGVSGEPMRAWGRRLPRFAADFFMTPGTMGLLVWCKIVGGRVCSLVLRWQTFYLHSWARLVFYSESKAVSQRSLNSLSGEADKSSSRLFALESCPAHLDPWYPSAGSRRPSCLSGKSYLSPRPSVDSVHPSQ